ncbi:MAG: hypothetical protein ABSD74_04330 [Rhizomicrobium sp.]
MRPAFVAQVLGQVFAGADSRPSNSLAAYRADGIPSGLLLDEKV